MLRAFALSALLILPAWGDSFAGPVASCPPGFAVLENGKTCVRVSGRVRADVLSASARARSANTIGLETRGRVQLDVRTQTELGPLRAVIRAEAGTR